MCAFVFRSFVRARVEVLAQFIISLKMPSSRLIAFVRLLTVWMSMQKIGGFVFRMVSSEYYQLAVSSAGTETSAGGETIINYYLFTFHI